MSRTIIVAAVKEELGALHGVAVGIGGIRSAETIGRVLAVEEPDVVVLVGTAGGLPVEPRAVASRERLRGEHRGLGERHGRTRGSAMCPVRPSR